MWPVIGLILLTLMSNGLQRLGQKHKPDKRPLSSTQSGGGYCVFSAPLKTKLMMAIWKGDMKSLPDLVRTKDNLNVLVKFSCENELPESHATTPLIWAVHGGHPETVDFLLRYGADPNFRPDPGESALSYAAREDRLPIVKLLLRYGAIVDDHNKDGETPLLAAASQANGTAVIRELISAGADIRAVNDLGHNAAVLAAENHNDAAVKLFKSLGIDPCARNPNPDDFFFNEHCSIPTEQ